MNPLWPEFERSGFTSKIQNDYLRIGWGLNAIEKVLDNFLTTAEDLRVRIIDSGHAGLNAADADSVEVWQNFFAKINELKPVFTLIIAERIHPTNEVIDDIVSTSVLKRWENVKRVDRCTLPRQGLMIYLFMTFLSTATNFCDRRGYSILQCSGRTFLFGKHARRRRVGNQVNLL